MSLRKGLVRFVVTSVPFVLLSIATQTRAQSQNENANATVPFYKTVSIKPTKSSINADRGAMLATDEVTVWNSSTLELIEGAYDVKDDQIVGAPSWLNSKRYDIEAKAHNVVAGEAGGRLLESGLLSKYFKLAVHRETRLIPVYELTAEDGSKLRESAPAYADSAPRVIEVERGRIIGREVPIATLARILSEQLGRTVLDKTELPYHYDVILQWPTGPDSSAPAILTAIHEQLGLRLQPRQMPKEFLVIDHVEIPVAD